MSYTPKRDIDLTGDPTAPTPASGDADTSLATTAFVAGEITAAISASGGLTFTDTDPRYVNASGDTMTGSLIVNADVEIVGRYKAAGGVPGLWMEDTYASAASGTYIVQDADLFQIQSRASGFGAFIQTDFSIDRGANVARFDQSLSGVRWAASAVTNADLTNKGYVDNAVGVASANAGSLFVKSSGDSMSGALTASAFYASGTILSSGAINSRAGATFASGTVTVQGSSSPVQITLLTTGALDNTILFNRNSNTNRFTIGNQTNDFRLHSPSIPVTFFTASGNGGLYLAPTGVGSAFYQGPVTASANIANKGYVDSAIAASAGTGGASRAFAFVMGT
jgi:formylmethanofuran dehydrogenase subunit C